MAEQRVLQEMTKDMGRQLRDLDAARAPERLRSADGQRPPSKKVHPKTKGAPDRFLEEFLSFTARVSKLESWQDELGHKPKAGASGGISSVTGVTPDIKLDTFKREGSGKSSPSKKVRMPPSRTITRVKVASNPPFSTAIVSDVPPKLQNLFQMPSVERKRTSSAERDQLALQVYAPNWRPKPKVLKGKKMRGATAKSAPDNLMIASKLWERSTEGVGLGLEYDESILTDAAYIFPLDEVEPIVLSRPGSRNGWEKGLPGERSNSSDNLYSMGKVRKSKKKKSTSRNNFLEELSRPQSALPPTQREPDIALSPPRELTEEEMEIFKALPRPTSALETRKLSSYLKSTPQRPVSRARSAENLPYPSSSTDIEVKGDYLASERSHSSRRRLGEHAAHMRLKPKFVTKETSEQSSLSSTQVKALGCPECFNAFGGVCHVHLQTTWKGSMKQAVLEEEEIRARQAFSPQTKLRVKLFTSAHQEHRGHEMYLAIEPDETIGSVKNRICEAHGTPTMFQRFIFRGHSLDDNSATMAQCGIDNSCVLFVVLQPPLAGSQVSSGGCEYCTLSLGGVCTRHLRDKRGDIYPRELRETFQADNHTGTGRADKNLEEKQEPTLESRLRNGKLILQVFRVEMLKRFNNVFDAWIYFDMDGDGSITMKEFVALCRPLKLPKEISIELVFKEIDAKEELMKLFPFTFVRAVIWHDSPYNLKIKSEIYRGVDAARVNRREIFRLAQERSSLPTPIFAGINDVESPASPARSVGHGIAPSVSSASISSSRPVSATVSSFRGCPQCEKAINGVCHRCLPVYKNGVATKPHTNAEHNYAEALHIADESKYMALNNASPLAFFELDGIECGKGSVVSVMFENDKWHRGYLDAYNPRTSKVRILFPDPRIGSVHASITSLLIKVGDPEQQGEATSICEGSRQNGRGERLENHDNAAGKDAVIPSSPTLEIRIPRPQVEWPSSYDIETASEEMPENQQDQNNAKEPKPQKRLQHQGEQHEAFSAPFNASPPSQPPSPGPPAEQEEDDSFPG